MTLAPSIVACGMVTAVGLDAAATCAAHRTGLNGFVETRFMFDGDWVQGAPVPLEPPCRGHRKLVRMAARATSECLDRAGCTPARTPVILCTGPAADASLLNDVGACLGTPLHPDSELHVGSHTIGMRALQRAVELLATHETCVVAATDSFLRASTLARLHESDRLLTQKNSDGIIPGEAAAAILLSRTVADHALCALNVGWGDEPSDRDDDLPLRGDGLTDAISQAVSALDGGIESVQYRICDAAGRQRVFKEASLALARTMRSPRPSFDIWHPGDSLGEIGAATVPCCIGLALAAHRKGYAPGRGVLLHFGDDDGTRAALVLGSSGHVE